MIRRWISNFIRKHRNKIRDLASKLGIVAVFVFASILALFSIDAMIENNENDEKYQTHKPREAVVKGLDVSKEQYTKDSNIVNKFLDFCNAGKIEEAYNLISDECKRLNYPTIEDFNRKYYSYVFDERRDYNLQAWISTSDYTVYRVKYTNDMMSTGKYNKSDIYEDYITLNKKSDGEEISVGKLITVETCEFKTDIDGLEVMEVKRYICVSSEEYEIKIKNNYDTTVLLDNLEKFQSIYLDSGAKFGAELNNKFVGELKINPGEIKTVKLKFLKSYSAGPKSESIKFSNFIKDYYLYIQNPKTEKNEFTIELED